ncbi:hypothetical protein DPMN_139191 [Dreissena polymorpha]|uniref:Uncharacterized protein n=2 Tax=Dreissena polymorpha TaxID=45954 RepID=A0A9D4G8Q1_DREPO|nr:hypothetical protein DPMN_139191 [Dreissena polymorpha]
MCPMTLTPVAVSMFVFLVCCGAVRGDDPGEIVDCTFDENVGDGVLISTSPSDNNGDYVAHNIYCYNDFKPCSTGNGCCYKGSDRDLWTDGELAGLVLNVTALFALSVLVLVTCGATYCNSREDAVDIFAGRKLRRR